MRKLLLIAGFMLVSNFAVAGPDFCPFNIDQVMPLGKLTKMLNAQGFKVGDIELDDCLYEVKVQDQNGKRWELQVEPVKGKLVGKEKEIWWD